MLTKIAAGEVPPIDQLERAGVFDRPIVTTLESLEDFFEAEEVHRDYAERNPTQPYILFNTAPKLQKLYEQHRQLIAEDD